MNTFTIEKPFNFFFISFSMLQVVFESNVELHLFNKLLNLQRKQIWKISKKSDLFPLIYQVDISKMFSLERAGLKFYLK